MSEKPDATHARVHPDGAPRTWSDDEETALRMWIALARCYQTFSRAVAVKIADYGLTMPQFGILEALYHVGPLSHGELAEKMLVTGGNVTYIMDRLESQGFVERSRSGTDRRVVEAHLTESGKQLMREVFPGHAAYITDLAEAISPKERERLRGLLKKLGTGVARQTSGGR